MTDHLDETALAAAAKVLTAPDGLSDYGSPEANGFQYASAALTAAVKVAREGSGP